MKRTGPPHLVVISSVEWRKENFIKLVKSLAQQTRQPEHVLIVLDGYSEAAMAEAGAAVDRPPEGTTGHVRWNAGDRRRGAGWRWTLALELLLERSVPEDTVVSVVDDDFLLMPDYLRVCHARVAPAPNIAIGWLGETPSFIPWTSPMSKDTVCISLGAGLLTCHLRHLRGIDQFVERDLYFTPPGDDEALVSFWLWKNGVKLIRPKGQALVYSVDALQYDERASFWNQSVYRHLVLRVGLREKHGWSTYRVPPELLTSHYAHVPTIASPRRWPRKAMR